MVAKIPQPKIHELDVVVLRDCDEISKKKKSVVSEGKTEVEKGEVVKWTNHSDQTITLFFPDQRLFDVQIVTIESGRFAELTVNDHEDFADGDRFPYAIHSFESNDFATGSREPEIIIRSRSINDS